MRSTRSTRCRIPGRRPCVLHVAHDLREEALLAHRGDFDGQGPEPVDRTTHHRLSLVLLHGHRLAGHERLVDGRVTADDFAVDGDALTRPHADLVPHVHL